MLAHRQLGLLQLLVMLVDPGDAQEIEDGDPRGDGDLFFNFAFDKDFLCLTVSSTRNLAGTSGDFFYQYAPPQQRQQYYIR